MRVKGGCFRVTASDKAEARVAMGDTAGGFVSTLQQA